MFIFRRLLRSTAAGVLLAAFWLAPISAFSQDLVPVSSLTGGSSVFVFRKSISAIRRVIPAAKAIRSKLSRMETVTKLKRQYETIAKTDTRRPKAKVIEPTKIPPNARALPPAEGAKILAGVGEYYINRSQFDEAQQFFRDALSLDPENTAGKSGLAEALSMKGNDLLVNEKFDAAKSTFLEALKYDPQNAAANFGLGEVYSQMDQPTEAIASYERSLSSNKELTEIYVPLGILYYQAGEIAKADDLLTKALATSAGSAETQYFLGLVRLAQNRNDEALAAFDKARTIDPNYAEAYYNYGEALVRLKRAEEAVPEYQKAISLKEKYFDAYVGLGEALYELKKYPESIEAFKAAAKLKNDNWEVFAGLAEGQRQVGAFNDAIGNYNLAIIFLTKVKDYNRGTLADLYSKTGFSIGQQCDIDTARFVACKWPAAIKALQQAADLTNDPVDQVNLGWAYFRAGHTDAEAKNMAAAMPNLQAARAALEKAMGGSPAVANFALQNLAAVQIDMGDQAGAIATLQKLIDNNPGENYLRYQMGVAYFKSNDLANAEKVFREALDKDANYVFALTGLGETLIARRNGKEVKKIVDRLRPLDADAAGRLELKAKAARL